ncbi:MAG: mechanosensitive ion channel family protein [Mariprofundaceae bacterium]
MLLNQLYLGNSIQQWIIAGGFFAAALLLLITVRGLVGRHLSRLAEASETEWDNLLVSLITRTHTALLIIVALFIATTPLEIPDRPAAVLRSVTIIALLVQACMWGNTVIAFWVEQQTRRDTDESAITATTANVFSFIAKLALYSIVALLLLDNLGIDVTALIASLGIGGIAVALALQNILADLFACLTISFDKPFVIGDFIIVGDLMGTVEHIGLKTTRIRSLSGEQLVFSNNDLLSSRIRNFKRMYERRVVFAFGLVYQTRYEQLVEIPGMVKAIIEAREHTRFDRAHFKNYGDSSLDFEVVYYVLVPDYNAYMDIQQAINLALFKQFEEKGLDFAYPTRTLYVNQEANQPKPATSRRTKAKPEASQRPSEQPSP